VLANCQHDHWREAALAKLVSESLRDLRLGDRAEDSAVANAAVIAASALSSLGNSSLLSFTSPIAARRVSNAVFTAEILPTIVTGSGIALLCWHENRARPTVLRPCCVERLALVGKPLILL
jgi:hypothetical protein